MIGADSPLLRRVQSTPPPTPDGDDARRWAEQELSHSVYQAAQPTPFDRLVRAILDFFQRLLDPQTGDGWGSALAVAAVVVLIAVLVVALLIWGRPRAIARSRPATASLFGDDEMRSAAELRRDAEAEAARDRWDAAIVLRVRALARDLDERAVVDVEPGATVHGFARRASAVFPAARAALEDAADVFDDVRYLRRPGTADGYRRVVAAEESVAAAPPPRLVAVSA